MNAWTDGVYRSCDRGRYRILDSATYPARGHPMVTDGFVGGNSWINNKPDLTALNYSWLRRGLLANHEDHHQRTYSLP